MEYQEVDEFLSKRPKLHMDGPTIVDEDISSIEVADNIPKEVGLTVENIDGDIFLKQENSLEKVDSVWLDDTEYGQKNVSNDIDHNESKDELNENEIVEFNASISNSTDDSTKKTISTSEIIATKNY